uniref:hypothetical protein n=1 Tax=Ornithobacterium rhinotracheale TaxID=28251 RepID=UPI0039A64160
MKVYYYLFYKLYKFWETAPARFWSDSKAWVSINALEIWILFSIFNYYSIIRNEKIDIEFTNPIIILPLIFIFALNYLLFVHSDKWKVYNAEFDKLPKKKNIIGGIIIWTIVIFIIANFFISGYYMQKNVLHLN